MYYDKNTECMDKTEKEILQSERLKEVVKLVYDNVETYRKKMDAIGLKPADIKSIKDIVKLPFTTKQDLRDGYPFGMFSAKNKEIIRLHASSGTTGKLTVVGYTKEDIDMWAEICARALVMAGVTTESIVHIAYGYGLFTGGLGVHYGVEKLGATAVPVSSGNTARQIQLLKDFKADAICCTPSYAIYLADEIKKMGLTKDDLSLKIGIFGAEPWTNEMRLEIEDKLGIKAFDIYGLSEIVGPGVAMECEYQSGAHIMDDHFYPEIVSEETGEQLPYGEVGELVFTTLTKKGIPLIRYQTHDITALANEICECGRTSVRIKRVTGRSDDMMIIRGVNVFPSQIESVLLNHTKSGIAPHYFITIDRMNNLDIMDIEVELSDNFAFDEVKKLQNLQKALAHDIASAIGISANIKLVSCGALNRSEGKAKRVSDKRNFNQ